MIDEVSEWYKEFSLNTASRQAALPPPTAKTSTTLLPTRDREEMNERKSSDKGVVQTGIW